MLYQLHWQSRDNPNKTIFVAQDAPAEFSQDGCNAMIERIQGVLRQRIAEMPDGFAPMICDENAPEFMWAEVHP